MSELSEDQSASAQLLRLGYRHLEKPINCDLLAFEAARIFTESRRLIREVAATACKIEFNLENLRAEIVESHRIFDSILRRLGHKKD